MDEQKLLLGYKHLDVQFIYGFLWRSKFAIPNTLFENGFATQIAGWKTPLLHERVVGAAGVDRIEEACIGAYQPTFVLKRCCLETGGSLNQTGQGAACLVVPMKLDMCLPTVGDLLPNEPDFSTERVTLPVTATWNVRIFDTGTGTFTVRVAAGSIQTRDQGYQIAHWLLHLAPNLDSYPEAHIDAGQGSLGISKRAISQISETESYLFTPEDGTFRLFDFFQSQLENALHTLRASAVLQCSGAEGEKAMFEFDKRGLAYVADKDRPIHDYPLSPKQLLKNPATEERQNQAPFAFLTAVVDMETIIHLGEPTGKAYSQEIASLCTRVAFSNEEVLRGDAEFSKDALSSMLRYDPGQERILNLCRDDRLFAAFSSRGAMAVTASPNQLPALFYVPSLLNLFEILRARLHGAIAVGSRLSHIASHLSVLDTSGGQPIDEAEYAELRRRVVANLQDPLQYLFDGGSLTDLAIAANAALFVADSWSNVHRAFDALDRLLTSWETVRFRRHIGNAHAT